MKKSIIIFHLICFVLGCLLPVSAQIGLPSHSITASDSVSYNFYTGATAQGDYTTFRINHSYSTLFQISNSKNSMVERSMPLKDGITFEDPMSLSIIDPVSTAPLIRAFVETFSRDEIIALAQNDESIRVGYAVTEYGDVMEVAFTMKLNHPHLYNIPP